MLALGDEGAEEAGVFVGVVLSLGYEYSSCSSSSSSGVC